MVVMLHFSKESVLLRCVSVLLAGAVWIVPFVLAAGSLCVAAMAFVLKQHLRCANATMAGSVRAAQSSHVVLAVALACAKTLVMLLASAAIVQMVLLGHFVRCAQERNSVMTTVLALLRRLSTPPLFLFQSVVANLDLLGLIAVSLPVPATILDLSVRAEVFVAQTLTVLTSGANVRKASADWIAPLVFVWADVAMVVV